VEPQSLLLFLVDRPSSRRKVLLIGWDGADWEHINPLLEEGLLPTLEAFINRGVMGNLATLQPVLSPMLWNSVATAAPKERRLVMVRFNRTFPVLRCRSRTLNCHAVEASRQKRRFDL
jgi:predicted AlkP superfamily phosphohydrolase/phosphomutase